MLPQLPPDLLTPNNLLLTSFVGIGLAIGAAVVYVKKNLLMPPRKSEPRARDSAAGWLNTSKTPPSAP